MPLDFQSLQVPAGEFTIAFPPADPWMAYLYVILILFALRLSLLGSPYVALLEKLLENFSPKESRKGVWKAFRTLRKTGALKGLYWLLVLEIVTLLTPPALAISFRLILGHPGRIGWSMESQAIFIAFALVWVIADLYWIWKTRKAINTLRKSKWSDPKRMKKAMSTLGWSLNTLTSIANYAGEDLSIEIESEKESKSKKALRLLRKKVEKGASAAKNFLESTVQDQIKNQAGMLLLKWLRNILFSLIPLSLLYVLSYLFS